MKFLLWRQNAGSEVGISLVHKAYGDGNALVKTLSGQPVRIDDMAEFVLWVALWGGRDSFVKFSLHGLLQFVMNWGASFRLVGAEYNPLSAAHKAV